MCLVHFIVHLSVLIFCRQTNKKARKGSSKQKISECADKQEVTVIQSKAGISESEVYNDLPPGGEIRYNRIAKNEDKVSFYM